MNYEDIKNTIGVRQYSIVVLKSQVPDLRVSSLETTFI